LDAKFIPDDFEPPSGLATTSFVLEPLGPQHNERDHAAWMSSISFIHSLPGFDDPNSADQWPVPMSLDDNLTDLEGHARDFNERKGFTYTVLDPSDDDVIGCVYIYPTADPDLDAAVQSWVRASHAHLDDPLRKEVSAWLDRDWPIAAAYASRI
jgi:hypothetical protein